MAEDAPPQPPDSALVAQAQRGETAAFDELIRRHSPRLYALIYHMTSNREDTNDLLQDVFAKAYRSLSRFRGQSQFYTWLYSIATNMTLNFLKKRNRRQHAMSLDDLDSGIGRDEEFIAATTPRSPEHEADLKELQAKLNEAMQKLSHDHRAVVVMYDIQGLPHAEISRIMGVSEGTIRSRLFYAHRQLQSLLDEFWKR
jgi:RNA polymerase sigma-70 factor (ECF subfamily)